MSDKKRNIFYLDMKFYPQWDIDLILLLKNDFPFKKYITILIENYIEGNPSPKIINWYKYVDLASIGTQQCESEERVRISFDLDKCSANFKDFFVNGVESRKRSAFCKALLRNAIDYCGKAPYEVETKSYCITFHKIFDLDLVSLATKYNIGKMIYDTLENVSLSYTSENVEPIYFYIDDYDSANLNTGKGFSITLKLISNSAIASILSQCPIDVSQFCKSILRSRILAQNLSSYISEGYEYYDKRIHEGIKLTDYKNIHMCSEYALSPGASMCFEFTEDKSSYIASPDMGIAKKTTFVTSSPYVDVQTVRGREDVDEIDSEDENVEKFVESETDKDIEKLETFEETEAGEALKESETNDYEIYNKYSDVSDEEIDMRDVLPREPVEDEDEANSLFDLMTNIE